MRFLGHVINESGTATDPDKVRAIMAMTEADLMMEDRVTPSQKKIKSFLGMVMFYQRFIQHCSNIVKQLLNLTVAPNGKRTERKRSADFKRSRLVKKGAPGIL